MGMLGLRIHICFQETTHSNRLCLCQLPSFRSMDGHAMDPMSASPLRSLSFNIPISMTATIPVHTKCVARPRGCRRQNAKTRKRENQTRKHENAKTKHENAKTRKRENAKTRKLSMCPEALGTRTLSQLWACVKYVPKQSIP